MTGEMWATLITTIVVPILLRFLVHYFPWLADPVAPGTGEAVKPHDPPEQMQVPIPDDGP